MLFVVVGTEKRLIRISSTWVRNSIFFDESVLMLALLMHSITDCLAEFKSMIFFFPFSVLIIFFLLDFVSRNSESYRLNYIESWPNGSATIMMRFSFRNSKLTTWSSRGRNEPSGSKAAGTMLTWSCFRFRQWLINKTREYPWVRVLICAETYTSKTCCGQIHEKLGGNKDLYYPHGGFGIDRDANGAVKASWSDFSLSNLSSDQQHFGRRCDLHLWAQWWSCRNFDKATIKLVAAMRIYLFFSINLVTYILQCPGL